MKYEKYITESTITNRWSKLIGKYTSDMKKLQDSVIKQAEFFINQVNNPEELNEMWNMLDDGDEIQDYIISIIEKRIDKLGK